VFMGPCRYFRIGRIGYGEYVLYMKVC
jgi:hypothetical protein